VEVEAWRNFAVLLVTAAMIVAGSAAADTATVRDAAGDTNGPIDLSAASHGHRRAKLVHTLRTHELWRGRALRGDGVINLTFNRQDGQDKGVERVMVVDYQSGGLVAKMFDVIHDREVGEVLLRRPDLRTLRLVFPKRYVKRQDPGPYRWTVGVTDDKGLDHLPEPERRAILHRI
jgi:hypothetical protein